MDPRKIRLVLDRPASADNLGAAARVLKNFGLSRLIVVAPPSWAGPPRSGGSGVARDDILLRARRMARKASDLLDGLEVHADLRSAVGPATWVVGTTSRDRGLPRLDPRALGAELVRRSAAGEVAIVFGQERRGMSDAELDLCHAVCTIPTSPAYDSMNLAQAVAVIAYEVSVAGALGAGSLKPGAGLGSGSGQQRAIAGTGPARHETVEALWTRAQALLGRAGYLNPQNPEHILADFRRLLARAEPTQREVELLVAAIRALERLLDRGRSD